MDFFRSVFSDDPESEPTNPLNTTIDEKQSSPPLSPDHSQPSSPIPTANPNPNPSSSAWSFGGLVKTIASRSESVIETYRRDLQEFRSGLEKETAAIRGVAARAVKDLPTSLEVGASAAQGSLETVGHAIDEFGTSVWRGTAEIISQGLSSDDRDDSGYYSSDSNHFGNQGSGPRGYSRFDLQVRAIQSDATAFSEEPEDLSDFSAWKLGFDVDGKGEEIENLLEENPAVEGIYNKLVPSAIDRESFWSRYFYRIHKLKLAEDARANLVKRAISGEEEELSWDVDDDDDEDVGHNDNDDDADDTNRVDVTELKKNLSGDEEFGNKGVGNVEAGSSGVEGGSKNVGNESSAITDSMIGGEVDKKDVSEKDSDKSATKVDEKMAVEGKGDNVESSKDSDVSIVSSQPSLPEDEDLGWDEIDDIGTNDEGKANSSRSPSRSDVWKRMSPAEEDEDLSWDIEDDDEPIKS